MDTFSVRDLRERPGEIVREAEQGHISMVTKRGHPVFITVPFDESLLTLGLNKHMSLHMLKEGDITLRQASKIAGVSMEEMISMAGLLDIALVDYPVEQLEEEVKLV